MAADASVAVAVVVLPRTGAAADSAMLLEMSFVVMAFAMTSSTMMMMVVVVIPTSSTLAKLRAMIIPKILDDCSLVARQLDVPLL